MESNKNLVDVKDIELTHNVYDTEGKSYGQETRERNERQRKWKARGVEPPPTREEIRRQANEAEEQRRYQYTPDINPATPILAGFAVMMICVMFASCSPSERTKYLNNHPDCKLISEEEMPEERVYCGKACTRPAVLETYQCGTRIKRLLN